MLIRPSSNTGPHRSAVLLIPSSSDSRPHQTTQAQHLQGNTSRYQNWWLFFAGLLMLCPFLGTRGECACVPVALGAGARSVLDDDEKLLLLRSWSVLDGGGVSVSVGGRTAGVGGVKRRALRASVRSAMMISWCGGDGDLGS